MAKKDVDVRIRAHDRATKAFRQSGKAAVGWGQTMRRVGGLVAGFVGFRAIARFTTDSIRLFDVQRQAEVKLRAALRLLGDETAEQLPRMKRFASSIQDVTTMGDEAVLQIMALGAGLGKLSGEALERATKAAIGLSEKLGIDTVAAMRLVARAAIGDTAMLKRYGVALEATLTPQEKFNELLRQGEAAFSLATDAAKEGLGPLKQLSNAWGDLKEQLGGVVAESKFVREWIAEATALLKGFGLGRRKAEREISADIRVEYAKRQEDYKEHLRRMAETPEEMRARELAERLRAEPGVGRPPTPLEGIPGMMVDPRGRLVRRLREQGRQRLGRGQEAFAGIRRGAPVEEMTAGRALRPELEKLTREELKELKEMNRKLDNLDRNTEVAVEGRSFK